MLDLSPADLRPAHKPKQSLLTAAQLAELRKNKDFAELEQRTMNALADTERSRIENADSPLVR